jgi:hypothetical protein
MPSDEMVEKVLVEWYQAGVGEDGTAIRWPDDFTPEEQSEIRTRMRAALSAAMGEGKPVAWMRSDDLAELRSGPKHGYATVYRSDEAAGLNTLDSGDITSLFTHPSREDVVEECAKVADAQAKEDEGHRKHAATNGAEGDASHYLWCVDTAESIAAAIRKLGERA